MSDHTIPRKQVLMCALEGNAIRMKAGDTTYRIDPHDALQRMLNGHDTYELTMITVEFTGSVDISEAQIMARLSAGRKP